jgi:hypothetical protein
VALTASLVAVVVAVGATWAEPRPIGDLFMALAVGRDVIDGKLGKPDDWAFTTQGRVCINQDWGSHLLHYGVHQAAGPSGLLVLKALLIAAAALFVCLATRQRGVSWAVAWTVAAGAIAAGRAYIDLRPNLTTLTLAPLALWMLWKTRQNPHWMWGVLLLNGVWANMHGGFIFGLGMTGLWVGVWMAQRTMELAKQRGSLGGGMKAAAVELWPMEVGVLGSVALAAVITPFGPTNLTFPFTIRDPAWQPLSEWQPLLAKAEFGSTWELFVAMGLLIGLLLLRVLGIPGVRASRPGKPSLAQVSMAAFDLVLTGVLLYMTFTARRFVPLAVMLTAPLLAVQIEWLVRSLGTLRRATGSALVIAMAAALVVPLVIHARNQWLLYSPDNPRYVQETVFDRMHGVDMQPVAAAQFLAANNVSGRVFNDWRWESYLHWKCPQLKLFIGGRAHFVYDRSIALMAGQILADPRVYPVDPARDLAEHGVHLVVVPIDEEHDALIGYLTARPDATWGFIFFDGKDAVIADAAWPETADLLRRAAAGELAYPDRGSALLSRAVALTAGPFKSQPADVLQAFLAAVQAKPFAMAYDAIRQVSRSLPDPASWQKSYFQQEYARLERMDVHRADGMRLLPVRGQLADYLQGLYAAERSAALQTGQSDAVVRASAEQARWGKAQEETRATLQALEKKWP